MTLASGYFSIITRQVKDKRLYIFLTLSCILFQRHHHPFNLYKTVDETALAGSGHIQAFWAEKPISDFLKLSAAKSNQDEATVTLIWKCFCRRKLFARTWQQWCSMRASAVNMPWIWQQCDFSIALGRKLPAVTFCWLGRKFLAGVWQPGRMGSMGSYSGVSVEPPTRCAACLKVDKSQCCQICPKFFGQLYLKIWPKFSISNDVVLFCFSNTSK